MGKKRATELEWLKWFYQQADFGPAHGDVMDNLQEEFTCSTGKRLPQGYDYDQSGEPLP